MNKGLIVAICIVVIVAAVGIMVGRKAGSSGPGDKVLKGGMVLIDKKTLATEEMPLEEWNKRGQDASGAYKSASGEYTMVPFANCKFCQAQIPVILPLPAVMNVEPEEVPKIEAAHEAEVKNYACPKCGKHPFQ